MYNNLFFNLRACLIFIIYPNLNKGLQLPISGTARELLISALLDKIRLLLAIFVTQKLPKTYTIVHEPKQSVFILRTLCKGIYKPKKP